MLVSLSGSLLLLTHLQLLVGIGNNTFAVSLDDAVFHVGVSSSDVTVTHMSPEASGLTYFDM